MKIGIITFWTSSDNYGQILQYFALQTYLQSIGHEPFLIKYIPLNKINKHYHKSLSTQITKLFNLNYIKYFAKQIWRKIYIPIINRFILNHNQDRNFKQFKNKYFNSSEIYDYNRIKATPPTADMYICGSDQIWSGAGIDDIFFLNFGNPNQKRISISASFGRDFNSLTKEDINRLIPLMNNLDYITVREYAGLDICHKLGRTDAQLLCDPTILNNVNIYIDLFDLSETKSEDIFIYYIGHETTVSDKKLYKYFKRKNKKIKYVSAQGIVNRIPKIFPSIQNWLKSIYDSQFIVTNSFHGTVFSILFQKNFATIALKSKNANTRIFTLLSILGLENRICTSIEELDKLYLSTIDYSKVTPIINKLRNKGQETISLII